MMPKACGQRCSTKYYRLITPSHSTTKETPFTIVYEEDVMLPLEIDTPSWRYSKFDQELNKAGLECVVDLFDELREVTHI